MSTGSVTAIRSLKRLEPSDVEARNLLLHLLGTVGAAATADFGTAPEYWFDAGENSGFALSVEGMGLASLDTDLACDMLDAAEPLLQTIEDLLSMTLEPNDLRPRAQIMQGRAASLVATLSSANLTLWMALPPDAVDIGAWRKKAASLPSKPAVVPVQIMVMLSAARLTLDQAASVASGDMLLLARNIPAMVTPAEGVLVDEVNGHFECRSGAFCAGTVFDDGDTEMADDNPEQSSSTAPAFTVPITLRLPGQFIDAGTLAALASGYVLPLSPLVQGLQVDILVGGKRIARGEIVELGDSFAVHIDERLVAAPREEAKDFASEDDG
jgi:flagellar motor switch/type III secretory pathway protein FliN